VEVSASGRTRGGSLFTRGQLHHLLTNPVTIGRIRHKNLSYPGQHPAIIDAALWDSVQAKLLAAKARPRGPRATAPKARMLTGKLPDETNNPLTPTHTQRRGRRFAYYVWHRLILGGIDPSGWRLPAEGLEASLRRIVVAHLCKAAEGQFLLTRPEAMGAATLAGRAVALAHQIKTDPFVVAKALDLPAEALSDRLLDIACPFDRRRRGVETRIIAGEMISAPDPVLQRSLAQVHLWAGLTRSGTSLTDVARKTGRSEPYIRNRVVLAFLAPRLQTAIRDGKQPPNLSLAKLLRKGIPTDSDKQEKLFGVA
jgi:site-specific DNA recombinase